MQGVYQSWRMVKSTRNMLWSKLFIPTLREAPAGIPTIGGRLLARAGYTRGDAHLFLGQKSLRRIARIIRQELDSIGAQEVCASPQQPMTTLARELRSYKQLPQIWYQSPWSGHAAPSQFHDRFEGFTFGLTKVDLLENLEAILRCCGVESLLASSLGGARLVIPSDAGEDLIARAGSYIAGLASAVSVPKTPGVPDPEGAFSPELLHTPGRKTIADLADFTGLPETSHIKSLVMAASDGAVVMALLRGAHQLNTVKLARALGVADLRPANAEEIRKHFGASPGSLGPVGVDGVRILADEALRGRRNMIAGANRDNYHLRHVTPGEDFAAEYFDLRQAAEGETVNGESLRIEKTVALASVARQIPAGDLHVTSENGQEVPLLVGNFSLSPDRILWAAAERHHDPDGLALPPDIAPFDLIVTPIDISNQAQRAAAETIAEAGCALGLEVLTDDRDERPGVKFKDADLTGIPWRVTVGKKLEQGIVEVVDRSLRQRTDVATNAAVDFIRTRRS